jgi:hypothetical protein
VRFTVLTSRLSLSVRACWCSRSAEAAAAADGQDILAGLFADAIEAAGPWATTVDCLAAALESVTVVFTPERHNVAPQRRAAIAANNELQERELLKRAHLASAIADAPRARRADDTTARTRGARSLVRMRTRPPPASR